jgi:hypothetical protein
MRDFSEREKERATVQEANKQKEAERKRRASEHATELEQKIVDYSRQRRIPTVMGREDDAVIVQRGNQRLVIFVKETELDKWRYDLEPAQGGFDHPKLHELNEDQMIDAFCDWLKNAS